MSATISTNPGSSGIATPPTNANLNTNTNAAMMAMMQHHAIMNQQAMYMQAQQAVGVPNASGTAPPTTFSTPITMPINMTMPTEAQTISFQQPTPAYASSEKLKNREDDE